MTLRKWPVIVAAAFMVTLVGGLAYLHRADRPAGASAAPAPTRTPPGVAVETAPVEIATVVEDIRAFGTLLANESVVISPEIPGRISRIHFREAEKVAAGAVMIELDAEILRAELAKARSDVALATANYERATTLAKQGTGTLRARDEASAAYQAAQANLTLAEARLSKTAIEAPFAGVAGLRAVSVGAYVSPGDHIVELASIDPLKIDFRVSETFLPHLRPGLSVRVSLDARPDEAFQGEIYAIDPIVDVGGRAIRLRARLPNANGQLSPGLFARIRIIVAERPEALLVPEAAVFRDEGKTFVYRMQDGRAARTEVDIGHRSPGRVEVRNGLERSAVVITAGHQLLRDGSRVEVVAATPRG